MIDLAQTKEPIGKAAIYLKLSGPGWLQGAVTLMFFVIGSKGVNIFENVLNVMVGFIVIAFFLVVGVLTFWAPSVGFKFSMG